MIAHQLKEHEEDIFAQMVELFELQNISPEAQFDIVNQIGQLLFQSTVMRCIEFLNPQQKQLLSNLMSNNAEPDDVTEFLEAQVEQYPLIVQEEIESIREELLLGGDSEEIEEEVVEAKTQIKEAQISPYAPIIDPIHTRKYHEAVDEIREERTEALNALKSLGKKKKKGFGK